MIFLNSASSAAALVFDLPLSTLTDTEGKPRKARVRKLFQIFEKTQYLMNTLYLVVKFEDMVVYADLIKLEILLKV